MNSVQTRTSLRRRRISSGIQERITLRISDSTAARLNKYASRHGLSGAKVAAALLQAIVRKNLYIAVLNRELLIKRRRFGRPIRVVDHGQYPC
jgi:hypothetical protein